MRFQFLGFDENVVMLIFNNICTVHMHTSHYQKVNPYYVMKNMKATISILAPSYFSSRGRGQLCSYSGRPIPPPRGRASRGRTPTMMVCTFH